MIQVRDVALDGLKLIQLKLHEDERGFFVERFNKKDFELGCISAPFVQDNHSCSLPGVLRGLHYQNDPPQGKLIGVVRGRIFDVCVDIRPTSPTFGKTFEIELSSDRGLLLWIPTGFAHGFCVLGNEPADVIYKVDAYYNPASESGILWSDADLKIKWPLANPIVSKKDQQLQPFSLFRHALLSI
jgi:dTDP-4-dehydrorhamnose 3,5-epimerase